MPEERWMASGALTQWGYAMERTPHISNRFELIRSDVHQNKHFGTSKKNDGEPRGRWPSVDMPWNLDELLSLLMDSNRFD